MEESIYLFFEQAGLHSPSISENPNQELRVFIKEESRIQFIVELKLLIYIVNLQAGSTEQERLSQFKKLITDMHSTDTAEDIFLAYGFYDGSFYSNTYIGKTYATRGLSEYGPNGYHYEPMKGLDHNEVNHRLRVVLCILVKQYLDDLPVGVVDNDILRGKYEKAESGKMKKVYTEAEKRINYLKDIEYVNKASEKLLPLIKENYGDDLVDKFCRYYRVGIYQNAVNYGYKGAVSIKEYNSHLEAYDAAIIRGRTFCEVINEGIVDVMNAGQRHWVDAQGQTRPLSFKKYTLKGMSDRINLTERYKIIRQKLKRREQELTYLQLSLITHVSDALLAGQSKLYGLTEFNKQHGTNYSLNYIAPLERLILTGESEFAIMGMTERKMNIESLLENKEMMDVFFSELEAVLLSFHFPDKKFDTKFNIYLNLKPDVLSQLPSLIDRLIFGNYRRTTSGLKRGVIDRAKLSQALKNAQVRNLMSNILQILAENDLADAANKIRSQGIDINIVAMNALRMIAESIAPKFAAGYEK